MTPVVICVWAAAGTTKTRHRQSNVLIRMRIGTSWGIRRQEGTPRLVAVQQVSGFGQRSDTLGARDHRTAPTPAPLERHRGLVCGHDDRVVRLLYLRQPGHDHRAAV